MSATAVRAWAAILAAAAIALLAAPAASGQEQAPRVRIPIPAYDGTLTPYTFTHAYALVMLVYDTLYRRAGGPARRRAGGAGRPWLARSQRRDDAGRKVTIRLRRGVRWHDGRPLTARDVAFSYDFYKRRFHTRFTPQLSAIRRIEAPRADTVVLHLHHRAPGLIDQPLSDVPILPRHIWSRLQPGELAPPGRPVGSGPYRLVEYRRSERYVFVANDAYFRGRPRVARIEVPFIDDFQRMVRALTTRRVDALSVTLPEQTQEDLRDAAFRTHYGSLFTGTILTLNTRTPPFDDPEARKAVSQAIDLQRLARADVLGGRDAVPADSGILHPDSGWATAGAVHRFEPQAARAAFARLNLPTITVLAPDNDIVRLEAGRQVVLALERAGARARLREVSPERLADAIGETGGRPMFEAAIGTLPALASFEPNYLRTVLGSGRDAALNYSGYRSAQFDDVAARAARETNPEERAKLIKDEIDIVARDVPVVPLLFQEGAFAVRPAIYDRWAYVPGTGILDKASFLPGSQPARADAQGPPPSERSGGPGSGIGAAGYIAAGLFAVIVAVAVVTGLRSRRRRR